MAPVPLGAMHQAHMRKPASQAIERVEQVHQHGKVGSGLALRIGVACASSEEHVRDLVNARRQGAATLGGVGQIELNMAKARRRIRTRRAARKTHGAPSCGLQAKQQLAPTRPSAPETRPQRGASVEAPVIGVPGSGARPSR